MKIFTIKQCFLLLTCVLLLATKGCFIIPIPHTRLHAYGVKGRIVDINGNPVPSATITQDVWLNKKRETNTDMDGHFEIKPLEARHGAFYIGILPLLGSGSLFPTFPTLPPLYSQIYISAEGFPKQRFSNRIYPTSDNASKREGNFFITNEIILHKPTTQNYLATVTRMENFDVSSIILCKKNKDYPALLNGVYTITNSTEIATILSKLSVPAVVSTNFMHRAAEIFDKDDFFYMVFLDAKEKFMNIGHVVKHDGTILNKDIVWHEKKSNVFCSTNADVTWQFKNQAVANLLGQYLCPITP